MSQYRRPAWIEIDRSAVVHNINEIRNYIGQDKMIMAVVKADGYGHGSVEVSKLAVAKGIERLGVALPEELAVLRDAGIQVPVHILSDIDESAVSDCVKYEAIPSVNNLEIAEKLNVEARKQKKILKIHVKVDTGMSRSGILPEKALDFFAGLKALSNISTEGMFTHFATADQPNSEYSKIQLDKFYALCQILDEQGLKPPIIHASNSAASVLLAQEGFNMVRIGLMTYGLHPCDATRPKLDLKQAFGLKAKISRIQRISKGTGVSYGITYIADTDIRIATLPLGYADGYTRLLSNRSYSSINGHLCRNVGNITMDQMMVELRDGVEAEPGNVAILISPENGSRITVDDIAAILGTINYEVTCMFTKRLPRVYIN